MTTLPRTDLAPVVTEAWIERTHTAVRRLADDYPEARAAYEHLVMPSPAAGTTRGANPPESRTPSGRDPAVTTGLIRAAHQLARAHCWAQFWTWPGLPWMPESMYGHCGEQECDTCAGTGQSVTVVDLEGTALPLLGWCVPCAGTGVARNLHPPDFPPSAWEVRSAAWQMAGYLSALRLREPKAHEEHVYVELLRAAGAAAGAVRWVSEPLPEPEVACSNCQREPATEGSLGSTCARYLRRTGDARPPHLWLAS